MCDDERVEAVEIPLVCVVTDLCAAEYDVILQADVVRELQATSVAVNVSNCDVSVVCDVGTETPDVVTGEDAPEDVDKVSVTGTEVDATALAQEQEQDPTLVTCWAQAQAGKGGFVVHNELLYHRDQVIVLAPDSGGKLCNKWQGPGTVVKVMSQNSYLVDLSTNGTRHFHANKMRHFVARVNGCSVINECDVDFGNVAVMGINYFKSSLTTTTFSTTLQ